MATTIRSKTSPGPMLTFPEEDGPVILEYFCTNYTRLDMATKTYVVDKEPKTVSDCLERSMEHWDTVDTKEPCPELALKPLAMFRDPFRKGKHKLVFCELDNLSGKPMEFNTRIKCKELLDAVAVHEPWYGFEQEFYFVGDSGMPLDYDYKVNHYNTDTNNELSMGRHVGFEREIVDNHLRACIYAGLNMYGMNRECTPSEWEYQLGPLEGMEAAYQLHVSRYILTRIAEIYGVGVTFWNPACLRWADSRATLHLNFSTKNTRGEGGMEHIRNIVERLEKHPQEKLLKYYDLKGGEDARWRLSGESYMPHHERFVCTVGEKTSSSIRIPTKIFNAKRGYIEERRPSSEADPYDVIRAFTTAALYDKNGL